MGDDIKVSHLKFTDVGLLRCKISMENLLMILQIYEAIIGYRSKLGEEHNDKYR